MIGKISEAEDLDINPEEITGEFQSVLNNHFGDDKSGRTEYMNSGDSVALLNRISSQVITKKTLDFLMALAKGEDISGFLKPEEKEEENGSVDSKDEEIVESPSETPEEQVSSEEETELKTEINKDKKEQD